MKEFIKEFKEFISRGNVMDMAVGIIIKAMNTASEKLVKKEEAEEKAITKVCPYCKSEVDIEATRCPHCTSMLEE